jgi:hypothetical protein
MAVEAGIGITVTFSGGYSTKIRTINLNFTAAALDTTGAGETGDFDTYVAGRRGMTGTFTAMWDTTTNPFGTTDYTETAFILGKQGTAAAITWDYGAAAVTQSVVITSIDLAGDIDAANTVAFGFTATGAPTIAVNQ